MARIKITGKSSGAGNVLAAHNCTVEVDGEVRRDVIAVVVDADAASFVTVTLKLLVSELDLDMDNPALVTDRGMIGA